MERKKPPVSLEDRGSIESGVSMRYDIRSRPPAPPVGDSAAIAIRMFRALVVCLDIEVLQRMKSPLKNESPGRKRPPGASRFSTFFNVAAIGGKSPRTLRLFDHSIRAMSVCQARGVAPLSGCAAELLNAQARRRRERRGAPQALTSPPRNEPGRTFLFDCRSGCSCGVPSVRSPEDPSLVARGTGHSLSEFLCVLCASAPLR